VKRPERVLAKLEDYIGGIGPDLPLGNLNLARRGSPNTRRESNKNKNPVENDHVRLHVWRTSACGPSAGKENKKRKTPCSLLISVFIY